MAPTAHARGPHPSALQPVLLLLLAKLSLGVVVVVLGSMLPLIHAAGNSSYAVGAIYFGDWHANDQTGKLHGQGRSCAAALR